MKTAMINEKRLLQQLGNFFQEPGTVLTELAQNAQRAFASKLWIDFKDGVLTAVDNGNGTRDYLPLLVLADSDWSENVMSSHDPAGWGLYHLYALSMVVSLQSAFGRLSLECQNFLSDDKYRSSIDRLVVKEDTCEGFRIRAVIREEVVDKIMEGAKSKLLYFPLEIYINGELLVRKQLVSECSEYPIKTVFQGNKVFINPFALTCSHTFASSPENMARQMTTIWYGIRIMESSYCDSVCIDVSTGTPLTPVLPYRGAIKRDERLNALYAFVRKETIAFCEKLINEPMANNRFKNEDQRDKEEKEHKQKVRVAMQIMSTIASQEELDQLHRFYVDVNQPHTFHRNTFGNEGYKIVHCGEVITSESARIYIDYDGKGFKEIGDTKNIFLPQDTITTIRVPDRRPCWLTVNEKIVKIEVAGESTYKGNFSWHKSTVCAEGKTIEVLAIYDGCENNQVFYAKSPRGFSDLADTIFERRIFNDDSDGDQYETQRFNFDQDVEKDISKILNEYSPWKLLSAIEEASGVRSNEIKGITIDRKNKKMIIMKKRRGEVILNLEH